MESDDVLSLGNNDADEKAYPNFTDDPNWMASREYLVDPNCKPQYGTHEEVGWS